MMRSNYLTARHDRRPGVILKHRDGSISMRSRCPEPQEWVRRASVSRGNPADYFLPGAGRCAGADGGGVVRVQSCPPHRKPSTQPSTLIMSSFLSHMRDV